MTGRHRFTRPVRDHLRLPMWLPPLVAAATLGAVWALVHTSIPPFQQPHLGRPPAPSATPGPTSSAPFVADPQSGSLRGVSRPSAAAGTAFQPPAPITVSGSATASPSGTPSTSAPPAITEVLPSAIPSLVPSVVLPPSNPCNSPKGNP